MKKTIISVIIVLAGAIALGVSIGNYISSRSFQEQELFMFVEWEFLEEDLFHEGWKLTDNNKLDNYTIYIYEKEGNTAYVKVNSKGLVEMVECKSLLTKELMYDYEMSLKKYKFELLSTKGKDKFYYLKPMDVELIVGEKYLSYFIYFEK